MPIKYDELTPLEVTILYLAINQLFFGTDYSAETPEARDVLHQMVEDVNNAFHGLLEERNKDGSR